MGDEAVVVDVKMPLDGGNGAANSGGWKLLLECADETLEECVEEG